MLHEALDGATLACGVTTLEDDDHPLPRLFDPGLELQQFDLEPVLLVLVGLAGHEVLVGVDAALPQVDELVVGVERHRSVHRVVLLEDGAPQTGELVGRRALEHGVEPLCHGQLVVGSDFVEHLRHRRRPLLDGLLERHLGDVLLQRFRVEVGDDVALARMPRVLFASLPTPTRLSVHPGREVAEGKCDPTRRDSLSRAEQPR